MNDEAIIHSVVRDMERYAEANNVPIIEHDSIVYIANYIEEHHIKKILEVGTAIGYSAILMSLVSSDVEVTTIERAEKNYKEAVKNIKACGLDKRIEVVFNDALDINLSGYKFDMIFIDAAKAQYLKFFEKFKYYLNDKGTIICDNIKFHGLVEHKEKIESKNVLSMVNKLEEFSNYLKSNQDFQTEFVDVGDGLSVSVRK